MSVALDLLQKALERIEQAPTVPLLVAIDGIPSPGVGLSPWQTWTLLFLVRQHARQNWVAETIKFRLGADLEAMAQAGAFGHPDVPQSGLVPGLTEWEYYFHGGGCCLTHRVSGESIDVDFFDDSGDWFDPYFLTTYLRSLRTPAFPEQRLIALHRSLETISLSITDLVNEGLLISHPKGRAVKVAPDALALSSLVEDLSKAREDLHTRAVSASYLGDWLLAPQCTPFDNPASKILEERAERCRCLRFEKLRGLYEQPEARPRALQAISELEHPRLDEFLHRALLDEPSATTSVALDIITSQEDSRWCGPLHNLLRRINPNAEIPAPHIWIRIAAFLLRHGHRRGEILRDLSRLRRHELGEAALLALEFRPEAAVDLFRRALRSGIPYNRVTAAAALAIIDAAWSTHELVAVLRESDDQEATAECRAALMAGHSEEARRIVEEWERRNPHEPEAGPLVSIRELSLQARQGWLQHEMERLHERVLPLRANVPVTAESIGWWPFRRGRERSGEV
jgi:hypothetical protein